MQAPQVCHKLLHITGSMTHKARRVALAANVMALLIGTRLRSPTYVVPLQVRRTKHCIKRADRLLSNKHLHKERMSIYTAVTRVLIRDKKPPVIIVDWSDMDECKRHLLTPT